MLVKCKLQIDWNPFLNKPLGLISLGICLTRDSRALESLDTGGDRRAKNLVAYAIVVSAFLEWKFPTHGLFEWKRHGERVSWINVGKRFSITMPFELYSIYSIIPRSAFWLEWMGTCGFHSRLLTQIDRVSAMWIHQCEPKVDRSQD